MSTVAEVEMLAFDLSAWEGQREHLDGSLDPMVGVNYALGNANELKREGGSLLETRSW